jgi:hypothetical protein
MTTLKTYSPIVRGVTAIGTGFVGLGAGLALSARRSGLAKLVSHQLTIDTPPVHTLQYSAITFPALARTQGLSKKQKVDFWKAAFDRGVRARQTTASALAKGDVDRSSLSFRFP